MRNLKFTIVFFVLGSMAFGQNSELSPNYFINQNQTLPILAGLNGFDEATLIGELGRKSKYLGIAGSYQRHVEKINSSLYFQAYHNDLGYFKKHQFATGISPKIKLKNNALLLLNAGIDFQYKQTSIELYRDDYTVFSKTIFGQGLLGVGYVQHGFFAASQVNINLSKDPFYYRHSEPVWMLNPQNTTSALRIIMGKSGNLDQILDYNINLTYLYTLDSNARSFVRTNLTMKYKSIFIGGSFSSFDAYSVGIGYQHKNKWSITYAYDKNRWSFYRNSIHKIGFKYILKTNEDNAKIQLQSMF